MVLTVCRRSLNDPGDLDDVFQATFLVLCRRSRAVGQSEVLGNWLFGVARRVCLLANRAAARRRKHEQRAAVRRGIRVETLMAEEDPGTLIFEEIERLPSAYRLPIVLCLIEGRSRAETAKALQWTEGMVRGRLARARRLLRTRLIRRGVAPGAALAALAREGMAAGAVPRGLIEKAARAATRGAAAVGVSAATLALTEEVIKIMVLKKLTLFAAVPFGAIVVAWAATCRPWLPGTIRMHPPSSSRPSPRRRRFQPPHPRPAPSRSMIRESPPSMVAWLRPTASRLRVPGSGSTTRSARNRSSPAPTLMGVSGLDRSSHSTGTVC